MDYLVITILGVIAFLGWVFAYLLHGELSQKDEFIQELIQENAQLASSLLRKETKECMTKRKTRKKSQTTSHPQ